MYRPNSASSLTPGRLFSLLLFGWFLMNVVQSVFTEIGNDEAYYWVYSQHPDWGFYDHPPMVALVIKLGTMLLGNSILGIRLFTMILQIIFLIVLFNISGVEKSSRNIGLFFIVAFSVVMMQIYGFVTTPDVPLLFFTALFLASYKYYVDTRYSWAGAILLSVCMAGLMYSKYHGAFVIIFVILSNPKLFLKSNFYVSVLIAVALYIPHILWQVNNDFPSFKYHLVERSKQFKWSYFPDFFVNQLPVFNPFTLGAGFYVFFKRKKGDYFERALKFLFAGFFIFFTFWNFKGRVEPHWTIAAAVPMIILVVREAIGNQKLRKYIYRVVAPSLLLILVARVFLIFDILPIRTEWHGDKQRVADLKAVANGRPVVFSEGFQMPSKYRFYARQEAHCMGALSYRNTQYDIWNFDESYWGKPVLIEVGGDTSVVKATLPNNIGFNLREVESYQPYKKLKIKPSFSARYFNMGEKMTIAASVENPYSKPYIIEHVSMPLEIYLVCWGEVDGKIVRHVIPTQSLFEWHEISPNESINGQITFEVPALQPGEYSVYFAAGTPGVFPATLQPPITITFTK